MDKLVSKSKYDPKAHQKFYYFHLFNKSASTYFLLFLIVGLIALAIVNTVAAVKKGTLSNIYVIWVLVITTIVLTVVQMIVRIKRIIKKESTKRKDSIEVVEVTKAVINRRIENVPGREVIGWEQVASIYETQEYIYIYLQDTSGFLITKKDIIEGDLEGFRKLVQNQLPKNRKGKVKYKITYKEKK